MATREHIKTAIKLGFDNGMKDGKQQIKYQSFSNVKRTATELHMLVLANAIDDLSDRDVISILNITEDEITE